MFRSLALLLGLCLSAVCLPATPLLPDNARLLDPNRAVSLTLSPLRSTSILLSTDEGFQAFYIADSARFHFHREDLPAGYLLALTPRDCGISTNALLVTDHHVIDLRLRVPECDLAENDFDPNTAFDAVVSLPAPASAPSPAIAVSNHPRTAVHLAAASEPPSLAAVTQLADSSRLYRSTTSGRYRGPRPLLVTETPTHTLITFSAAVGVSRDLPVVYRVGDDDRWEQVNYDVHGSTLQLDSHHDRLALVPPATSKRQKRKAAQQRPHLIITRGGAR